MITKYKRVAINRDAQLHDKLFVKYDDVERLLESVLEAAVKAGADADKMMELVNSDNT